MSNPKKYLKTKNCWQKNLIKKRDEKNKSKHIHTEKQTREQHQLNKLRFYGLSLILSLQFARHEMNKQIMLKSKIKV